MGNLTARIEHKGDVIEFPLSATMTLMYEALKRLDELEPTPSWDWTELQAQMHAEVEAFCKAEASDLFGLDWDSFTLTEFKSDEHDLYFEVKLFF